MASNCLAQHLRPGIKRRSRFGCRNCKLRKIKCNEKKPQCEGCTSLGILCNFKIGVPDFQPLSNSSARQFAIEKKVEIQPSLTYAIWTSDTFTFYQLDARKQDFVNRYLGKSLITPHDPNMRKVNAQLLILAFTHPFLMHASLAVALAYDRHLNSPDLEPSPEECYHTYQASVLFNKRLKEPIEAEDKDPIWGTAAALALLTFSSPESNTPKKSWPMTSSCVSDFAWLRISKGKMSLWSTVNPLRPDSIFYVLEPTYAQMNLSLPASGIDGISKDLAVVCQLEHSSTADNNPYFDAAHALSKLLNVPDSQVTLGHTEVFTRCIHGFFQSLLLHRDPVALLLLYIWYRKAGRAIWWIEARAKVERPAICLYLNIYHQGYHEVHDLLQEGYLEDI